MKWKDAFRAQYFLSYVEEELVKIEKNFSSALFFSKNLSSILSEFSFSLVHEIDQILLPVFTYEISKAKRNGLLVGKTPKKRYKSFFVKDDSFTKEAVNILSEYEFVFRRTKRLIKDTYDSLSTSLKRFSEDESLIKERFSISKKGKLDQITPLEGSDRHRSQQALLYRFSDGTQVIYKPVDLRIDILFEEFIQCLGLEFPYNLLCQKILLRKDYGWINYIKEKQCQKPNDVFVFYQRIGVLLSVAESLNYTDGHSENLLADGSFPMLLDKETLFQNYEDSFLINKSILSTQLIQKINDDRLQFLNSALQAVENKKYEFLYTHPINDQTDNLQIRYCGVKSRFHQNFPVFQGKSYPAHQFVPAIIDGYQYGYKRITESRDKIFQLSDWWVTLEQIKSRIVLRETISYIYLLRQLSQPTLARSENTSVSTILEKLKGSITSEYEISDLLKSSIPYFYQKPGNRDLYNGDNENYPNFFTKSAIERLKEQFFSRTDKKMNFDCEIISKHLIPT